MSVLASLVWLLLWLLTALLALPVGVLALQVLFALKRDAVESSEGPTERPDVAIVMPAHNEGAGIAATLRSIRQQLRPRDRLLVVADNCSDDTAAIARAEGAECVERQDSARRGKGYALDFGVRALERNPRPVVVILDADCLVAPGSLDKLVDACAAHDRPVQGLYLMESAPDAGLRMRVGEFAWRVRNHARPLGAMRLGAPCQLMGTGMAFPWALIREAPLASGHIVEDLQLGVDLARRGKAPMFLPEARVTSRFPDAQDSADAQRKRWEHGHMSTLFSSVPRLLIEGVRRRNAAMLWMAADLAVPPLALLALLTTAIALANLLLGAWLGSWTVALAGGTLLALLLASILLAWARFGRDLLSLGEIATAPWYALRKIPLYLGFFIKRQTEWVRAKRDGE